MIESIIELLDLLVDDANPCNYDEDFHVRMARHEMMVGALNSIKLKAALSATQNSEKFGTILNELIDTGGKENEEAS